MKPLAILRHPIAAVLRFGGATVPRLACLGVLAGLATIPTAIGQAQAQTAPAQKKAAVPATGAPGAPAVPPATPAVPPGPVGVWIDHTGRGAVEIQPCPTGLCGRIVWLQEPLDKKGQPLRDIRNEDRKLRTRSICGLEIIGGLKSMRDGSWDKGWIYDPEQGESFDVELRLQSPDLLKVTGYKGLKFLSETFQWKRAAQLPAPACPPGPA